MQQFFLMTAASIMLVASPALAFRVTNLDKIPHTVELSGTGAPEKRVIQPDATEYFTGASRGFLSLVSAQVPKKSRSKVNADGVLSGVIGNERTEGIPADPEYNYVIWPGGHLYVQSRTHVSGGRRH